jgi:hypothetical protein
MHIPTKTGRYEFTPDILATLQYRYPLANVEREVLLAGLYLAKWRSKRPTNALRFMENWLKRASPKAPAAVAGWWTNEVSTVAMGAKLGLTARPRESWGEFRGRIRKSLQEAPAGRQNRPTIDAGQNFVSEDERVSEAPSGSKRGPLLDFPYPRGR